MARGRNRSRRDNRGFSSDVDFSDVRIDEAHKDDFLAWAEDYPEGFDGLLLSLAIDGYRITIKRDFNSRAYQCSLTQQDDRHHNSGIVVVSRSTEPVEAVWMSGYKVFRMYPDETLPTGSEAGDWG